MLLCVAVALGAFEGIFGRTFYSADAVSYLDVTRALHAGDWRTALSTYWGLGYPLLLSLWLPIFPSSAMGEWIGIHCLNLLILVVTFFSFYSVVVAAFACIGNPGEMEDDRAKRYLILVSFPVFLTTEVFIDSVSRVSPDMLVSCLVFAAVGTLLRLSRQPLMHDAIILGALLGAGYIVKGVFLPLSFVFAGIEFALLSRKRKGWSLFAATLALMAALAIPYAMGMSWAFGHRTFGEVGGLNYAWRVNGLQGDIFWQGGPQGIGMPEHPPRQVMANPSVFLFDGPQQVTFPPWFNPPYFYYGYRHFFSMNNQIHALLSNSITVLKLLRGQGVLYFLLIGLFLRWCRWRESRGWIAGLRCIWPMLAASLAGLSAYLAILVYPRYIASFVGLFLLALCVLLVGRDAESLEADVPRRLQTALLVLLLIACIAGPIMKPRESYLDPVGHIERHEFFWNSDQWKAGQYLILTGARPGEKVAAIADNFICSWAYIAHLKIVGQLGGETLSPQPNDLGIFWHASQEKQRQILETLHGSGAQLVIALEKPPDATATGWEMVPGTGIWIFRRFR